MDRVFTFLKINVLAFLCWGVAFFAWKDYLTHPHAKVTPEGLVYTTGPLKHLAETVSLPSGSQAGYWLMLSDPRRDFNVPRGLDARKLAREAPEGTQVTVGHSPEVDPAGATAAAFSLTHGDTEYLDPPALIRSYNAALDGKVRLAGGSTAGGFVLLGLMMWIRKKLGW